MKLQLRLSRIEEECAKLRRPSRNRSSQRSAGLYAPAFTRTESRLPLVDSYSRDRQVSLSAACGVSAPRVAGIQEEADEAAFSRDEISATRHTMLDKIETHKWSRRSLRLTEEDTKSYRRSNEKLVLTENTN